MENRFNNLTSKEWLPFQKSWFIFENKSNLIEKNIRFFTKASEKKKENVFINSNLSQNEINDLCKKNNLKLNKDLDKNLTFGLIDLLNEEKEQDLDKIIDQTIETSKKIFEKLDEKKFLCIVTKNLTINNEYYPLAWDLAYEISKIFSLKDEKIGCLENKNIPNKNCLTNNSIFYSLYFKKDENSKNSFDQRNKRYELKVPDLSNLNKINIKSWNIIKPKPRKKDEILHPAKYPEELVEIFLKKFTKEKDNVFDPMCGTGSTQVAALKNNRNAYGCELSKFFYEIALKRCNEVRDPIQKDLFAEEKNDSKFKILNIDCRKANKKVFPEIDYIITSPPYWDMLNMKGAENQAKRREKDLKLNYSEDKEDLGNIDDYNKFLKELIKIYKSLIPLIKSKGFITIIVKNIKKGGKNYPLAWDICKELDDLILLEEIMWLQDDQSIAPYGYGNTFVTNTFHHYCLNFQKK